MTVIIRPLQENDAGRLALLANNKNISDKLRDGFPHPYTIKDAKDFIAKFKDQKQAKVFAIEYNGEYVGNIGLTQETDIYRNSAELGYFIGEPYWNMGITSKAIKLICEYGFNQMDIIRIHCGVFEYNLASQRLLEKCGFQKEGIFKKAISKKGKIWDEVRFAKLKEGILQI